MWWGYSSSLDLLNECGIDEEKGSIDGVTLSNDENETSINVLLAGQSDCRHVLKTMSKMYCHKSDIKVNFYIWESLVENVARELLFLVMALEPSENIGLADKTKFFMELYGNTLIRPATSNYLSDASQELLQMVTDLDYAANILPSVSLDNLRYRERDQLEIILKYWSSRDDSFDILTSWDRKMRSSLGLRYDSKFGVFDWDFHMRYRSFGAEVLNIQEYKRFRERGMAFYFEDTDPCIANRTLASAIVLAGSKIINYGYIGDIVTGPYPAFGFECEDSKMLEKVNGYPKNTATDITENNIMRIFYEIMNQKPFSAPHSENNVYSVFTEDSSSKLQIRTLPPVLDDSCKRTKTKKDGPPLLSIGQCHITFLPTSALKDILNKPKYENFFDVVTFPQVMVMKHFTADLIKVLKPNCKIIVDTPKYLLNYRKEDLEKFKSDLENLMKQCNCIPVNASFNYDIDEFMRFLVSK